MSGHLARGIALAGSSVRRLLGLPSADDTRARPVPIGYLEGPSGVGTPVSCILVNGYRFALSKIPS